MKKASVIFVAVLLVAVSVFPAFATGLNSSENNVLGTLKTSVRMNGTDWYWPADFTNQVEQFFNTIELTADQEGQIVDVIKEGKEYLETKVATNDPAQIVNYSSQNKQDLMSILRKIMAIVDGSASYDKSSKQITLTYKDKNGNEHTIFTEVPRLTTRSDGKPDVDDNGKMTNSGVIKTTGASVNAIMLIVIGAAVVLAMTGGVFFVVRKRG